MARPSITMSTCSIMYVIGRQRDDSLTQLTPEAILSQMTCRHQKTTLLHSDSLFNYPLRKALHTRPRSLEMNETSVWNILFLHQGQI